MPPLPRWPSEREALHGRIGPAVLIQGEMPSNAQAGGHFQLVIFDGPLDVDRSVGPLSLATRAAAHVLLFARADMPLLWNLFSADEQGAQCQERLIFLWAMAPIPVNSIARDQTDRAIHQVGLVRDAFTDVWRLLETGHGTVGNLNQTTRENRREVVSSKSGPREQSQVTVAAGVGSPRAG